jgi:hypothetical protein
VFGINPLFSVGEGGGHDSSYQEQVAGMLGEGDRHLRH